MAEEEITDPNAFEEQAAEQPAELQTDALAVLREELAAANDRALRSHAELDNYRKRAQRQIDEERQYANLPLLRDLLPVLDNVQRAIEAGEKAGESAGLLAGIKLVAQQLGDVLARYHCTPIDSLNQPFDPNVHQAIAQQPTDEHPANTVMAVVQAGFRLHDRVVRPTQVIVSRTNNMETNE